jgi:hypothetical protein
MGPAEELSVIVASHALVALSRRLGSGAPCAPLPGGARLSAGRVAACTLAEFPEGAVFDPAEWLACVRVATPRPVPGVAILALDPHCVLRLAGAGLPPGTPDPGLVARYLGFGHAALEALVAPLGRALGAEPTCGPPELFEGALVPCVLSTHAPPDTVVLSVAVAFEKGAAPVEGTACWLLPRKPAGRLLEALAG